MALSLGAEGITHLEAGQWQASVNYRFLYADNALVEANRQKNIYDDRYGAHGPGAFADFLIITSYTRRF